MHRTITLSVPADATDTLVEQLNALDEVISLAVERGASVKPPGDVLTVHALNRAQDDVLRAAAGVEQAGSVSVVTQEVASLIDPEHQALIAADVDEAAWEEAITSLHRHGAITANYCLFMLLGAIVATAALVMDPVSQAIAFAAAAIIAPAFEPLARIPFGLVLKQRPLLVRGMAAVAVGYAILLLSSAALFLFLHATGAMTVADLTHSSQVYKITHPPRLEMLVSVGGAAAGIVMVVALQRSLLPGALMALALVPTTAIAGTALAAGQESLFLQALKRMGVDMLLVLVFGLIIVFIKQRFVHRRLPMT